MSDNREYDALCWYVIQTRPKQEDRADLNLRAWKVETFAPKFKESRRDHSTGRVTYVAQHLFPRYIFARFDVNQLHRKVCFTRGVHSVVSFGGTPCRVDDDIIQLIQSRMGEDGFIRLGEHLTPGDSVIIDKGHLKNFAGILEGKVDARGRVTVLLTAVNYHWRAVVEQGWVRKIGSDRPTHRRVLP